MPATAFDFDACPVAPHVDQNAVALRLTGEICAGRAERHALLVAPRVGERFAHVLDVLRDNHHFRKQPIRTRVARIAHEIYGPAEHAIAPQQSHESIVAQSRRRARSKPIGRACFAAATLSRDTLRSGPFTVGRAEASPI